MHTMFDLERIAAAHWRGTEEERLGDWLLRAAGGFTGRANSVLPLGDPGLPLDEALAVVTRWYRDRGLPPTIAVPLPLETGPAHPRLDDELSERLWLTRPGPAFVMVADLPLGAGADGTGADGTGADGGVAADGFAADGFAADGFAADGFAAGWSARADREPDDAWAAMYHYRGADHLPPVARKVLTSAREQSFVSIRDGDAIVAIARLSVAEGWAGLTAVEVHAAYRRRGLGTAITAAACREAERRGVSRVFLQVETGNNPARALYERLGFRYTHRYHYRIAPA